MGTETTPNSGIKNRESPVLHVYGDSADTTGMWHHKVCSEGLAERMSTMQSYI